MVLKYSDSGRPYREPPYSKEELRDLEARIYKTPICITRPVGRTPGPPAAVSHYPGGSPPDATPIPGAQPIRRR
jgi:hypothetical protein